MEGPHGGLPQGADHSGELQGVHVATHWGQGSEAVGGQAGQHPGPAAPHALACQVHPPPVATQPQQHLVQQGEHPSEVALPAIVHSDGHHREEGKGGAVQSGGNRATGATRATRGAEQQAQRMMQHVGAVVDAPLAMQKKQHGGLGCCVRLPRGGQEQQVPGQGGGQGGEQALIRARVREGASTCCHQRPCVLTPRQLGRCATRVPQHWHGGSGHSDQGAQPLLTQRYPLGHHCWPSALAHLVRPRAGQCSAPRYLGLTPHPGGVSR